MKNMHMKIARESGSPMKILGIAVMSAVTFFPAVSAFAQALDEEIVVAEPPTQAGVEAPSAESEVPENETEPLLVDTPISPQETGTAEVQGAGSIQETIDASLLVGGQSEDIPQEEDASVGTPEEETAAVDLTSEEVAKDLLSSIDNSIDPPPTTAPDADDTTEEADVTAEKTDPSLLEDYVEEQQESAGPRSNGLKEREVIAKIPLRDLAPKAEYSFSITKKSVPTKKRGAGSGPKGRDAKALTISQEPSITTDATAKMMTVRGSCSSAYFVILLYKNIDDYADNPSSYVLNRAYACTNGAYSYDIRDLPETLSSGEYYLLVGEQGDSGPWVPITALAPVSISHNHD